MQKLTAEKASDIVKHYELEEESGALLTEDQKPDDFLAALMEKELYSQVIL